MQSSTSNVKIVHSSDGTAIYADATGDPQNPHLVLTAGLSLSAAVYDDFIKDERLRSLYIVRYDVRGHGRSGKPSNPEAYESKLFADDFKAVVDGFKLSKPIYAGWSMGAAIASDITAHLPSGSLSGVVYISGIPASGEILSQLANPDLAEALPGLISTDDVLAYQTAAGIFVDKLFVKPEAVPWTTRLIYTGHSLTPAIMRNSLMRNIDASKLFEAGKAGLPMMMVQGTLDGHRIGAPKTVDDFLKPEFVNYEAKWLEGKGHALHYDAPDELAQILFEFTKKYSGKDYRTIKS